MLIISEKTKPEEIIEYLKDYTRNDEVEVLCPQCDNTFKRTKRRIMMSISDYKNKNKSQMRLLNFCSRACGINYNNLARGYFSVEVTCKHCSKVFRKNNNQVKKTPNNFCSRSCAASYNNTHKTHGTRRSKLEEWLEKSLQELYPNIEIHFNRKDAINSELDIYFPSLKLAFELNGIFHYEPIYGEDKLKSIQNNDDRKFQACIERGIELCIIDVSSLTYFKEKSATKYLGIIVNVLNKKGVILMVAPPGFEPKLPESKSGVMPLH
jgi:uncharacterized C2H2 Zn-finger protein